MKVLHSSPPMHLSAFSANHLALAMVENLPM